MKRRIRLTLFHGLLASFVLHSAIATPFVLHGLETPPDDDSSLVIELQAPVAERQVEQQTVMQTKGEAAPVDTKPPATPEPSPPVEQTEQMPVTNDGTQPPMTPTPAPVTPTEASPPVPKANAGDSAQSSKGAAQQQQDASTIVSERVLLELYVKTLAKNVQNNVAYPDEARREGLHGTAEVSFTIMADGLIRADTLKIIDSSGQPKLDAAALKTIRESAPFPPPPKELTISIALDFARKN
jgi:periplasmic protein TonB